MFAILRFVGPKMAAKTVPRGSKSPQEQPKTPQMVVLGRFGVVLGSFGGRFGVVLGVVLGRFGVRLVDSIHRFDSMMRVVDSVC